MSGLESLQKEIDNIRRRNRRVELDKAWETSWSRRVLLIVFIYLAIGLYMYAVDISRPWLNSIVPTFGFFLSTLTLPIFKKLWFKYFYKE